MAAKVTATINNTSSISHSDRVTLVALLRRALLIGGPTCACSALDWTIA